jgi:DNA-binding NtrC family response regulator
MSTHPTGSESRPLLVIEDEPSVQVFLRTALERAGFHIMRLLQQHEVLGVISDMRTPGGVNGGDVHSWIAQNRPELTSRLLFITGDIVNEETTEILRKTGVRCIEKPFRVNELLSAVRQVLGN